MTIRLHHIEPASNSNGPGSRFTLWVQGCPFRCPGCFNPGTHDFRGGFDAHINGLAQEMITSQNIEGITVSGGEPLHPIHRTPLLALLTDLRQYRPDLSVIIFSGFEPSELNQQQRELLNLCDTAILGRYQQSRRVASGLMGSSNKAVWHLSGRYTDQDFAAVPEAEIWIDGDGEIRMSGIDPLRLEA